MTIAVSTKNLSKDFKGNHAVDRLNIEVPEGSIYGFLGPNGAGKTTTLKMLTGMIEPSSGDIEIFGEKVIFGHQNFHNDIGFLPDVPGFYDWMSAKEYLLFCGSLYHIDKKESLNRTNDLLTLVGLTKQSNKKIGSYSRGMKQRLGIAQALINKPKIIFLDEPVSALDPIGRKEVIEIIGSLAGKVTVFFSTHILSDIEKICDRIIIIKDGKALLEDSIENIRKMSQSRDIEIEFDNGGLSKLEHLIKEVPWVESYQSSHNKIVVKVLNLDKGREELIKIIASNQLIIKKFLVFEPTLEDIFMKVVSNHA
ncbi:MAG: ABC transporter ATP-binding protein [Firmicutes bacterium]|nr:ABC transporter ATP-binding protein [Bacillota bacterium]